MNDLDDKIRNALNPNDAEMIGNPDDGLRIDQWVLSALNTHNRLLNAMMVIISIIIMVISVWCAFRFFDSQGTKELLGYGFGFMLGMFMISFIKIWFWMEMQRIAITREVKKVELLTARLLEYMRSQEST